MIKRVLCVCKGNSDRSPMMAAVLRMYLSSAASMNMNFMEEVVCESAGILEIADKGGGASTLMTNAAQRVGINLAPHERRWVKSLNNISNYDLFVCVDAVVAAYLIMELGVDIKKVCNAEISNPWPSQFQQDFDHTAEKILAAMFRILTRHFFSE